MTAPAAGHILEAQIRHHIHAALINATLYQERHAELENELMAQVLRFAECWRHEYPGDGA
jgi:hypothetical protein